MTINNQSSKPGCLGFFIKLLRGAGAAAEPRWPFERKRSLLTEGEMPFYRVLLKAVGDRYVICPKVRLGDLLKVRKATEKPQSWRNRIDRKHADFVLCDPKSMSPVMVIELDDASHGSAQAQQRDAVKDRALDAAGLPLCRIPAKRAYRVEDIAADLRSAHPSDAK